MCKNVSPIWGWARLLKRPPLSSTLLLLLSFSIHLFCKLDTFRRSKHYSLDMLMIILKPSFLRVVMWRPWSQVVVFQKVFSGKDETFFVFFILSGIGEEETFVSESFVEIFREKEYILFLNSHLNSLIASQNSSMVSSLHLDEVLEFLFDVF